MELEVVAKHLKSALAALDPLIAQALCEAKNIQAEIAPKPEEADGVENKQAEANTIDARATDANKSLVAEPTESYCKGQKSMNNCAFRVL